MKKKKLSSGKVVSYGFSDPKMHQALRSHRHTVIADKKKQASRTICRSRSNRDHADFFEYTSCTVSGHNRMTQMIMPKTEYHIHANCAVKYAEIHNRGRIVET